MSRGSLKGTSKTAALKKKKKKKKKKKVRTYPSRNAVQSPPIPEEEEIDEDEDYDEVKLQLLLIYADFVSAVFPQLHVHKIFVCIFSHVPCPLFTQLVIITSKNTFVFLKSCKYTQFFSKLSI